jgi:hypothetical protein
VRETGACAITLAALLNAALESTIHTKLIPNISKGDRHALSEDLGILATLAAKNEMALVLGLIGPETHKGLDCIPEIPFSRRIQGSTTLGLSYSVGISMLTNAADCLRGPAGDDASMSSTKQVRTPM